MSTGKSPYNFKCLYLFINLVSFLNIWTSDGLLAQRLTPNLEDEVICNQGFIA